MLPAPSRGASFKDFPVAMRTYGMWMPGTKERLDVAVWYPGGSGDGEIRMDGLNIAASHNSRIIPGYYAIVLLSHDTAANRFANHDLATTLAGKGFVVIAPTHMGDNQNSSELLYSAQTIFKRPRELLQALEIVLNAPELSANLDESRIGVIGAGFGSITAMQLAGADPDAQGLAEMCAATEWQDVFCQSWSGTRLSQMAADFVAIKKQHGKKALTPPLTLFSPTLELAPPAPPAPPPPVKKQASGPSFWSLLFSKKADPTPEAPVGGKVEDTPAPPLVADFHGGTWFSPMDPSAPFPDIQMPTNSTPPSPSTGVQPPEMTPARPLQQRAHRRPADRRHLHAAVLLAPAGGMLFSKAALANVTIPVAIVEAAKDEIYPLVNHSQPYYKNLSILPETLKIAEADHYSLFAPCAPAFAELFPEACGRFTGGKRRAAAEQRDDFIVSFLLATLGSPLPQEPPSGFVATQPAVAGTPAPKIVEKEDKRPSSGRASPTRSTR